MACARLIRSKIADTSSFSQTEFVLVHVRFTPKADMCGAQAHVCFGPKADIQNSIGELAPRGDLLPARSRNKAPDLCPAFIVLVRPYDGQPELVGYSHQRVGRYLDPLAVKSHPIFSIFRIPIHILDGLAISN